MRLCDFIRKISGDFTVKVYKDNKEVIKEGIIADLKAEEQESFDVLEGFSDDLWEKSVKDFVIKDNVVAVLVEI